MRRIFILVIIVLGACLYAQPPGYYNGIEGKNGDELKSALNDIITNHVDFNYSDSKYIMQYADADPANSNNMILFYTRRSHDNEDFGTGGDYINREHVWAKSHGDFSDVRPMDGDVFNLHPADASVNITRSNKDFDECSESGTLIAEANAYYTGSQFEPSDDVKGRVARTLFYMATRYEGENSELDLEMADELDVSPAPKHGKLSTLLQWNAEFPPDDFERRRNERIFQVQGNRNPFIDQPELADLIWGGITVPDISMGTLTMNPEFPVLDESTTISLTISSGTEAITGVKLYFGASYDSETSSIDLNASGDVWSTPVTFSGVSEGEFVYLKVIASTAGLSKTLRYTYKIPMSKTITAVSSVQGTGTASPLDGDPVTVAGIVTANFDGGYYFQDSRDPRSGICIYDVKRGKIGDSLVVTGIVDEYSGLTEIKELSYHYNYGQKGRPEPIEISISDVGEDYEGSLVVFKGVSFVQGGTEIPLSSSATLQFSDGISTMDVYARYNSRINGHVVPAVSVDVIGVLSEYDGNYQVLIDNIDDIKLVDDNQAPAIVNVEVLDEEYIEVSFDEKVSKTSAENIANYSVDGGVSILTAYLIADGKVWLGIEDIQAQDYTLTVNGVEDLTGNAISGATFDFHSDFPSVGLHEYDAKDMLKVYPNPASEFVRVFAKEEMSSIDLYEVSGALIEHCDVLDYEYRLNLSELSAGVYFIKVNYMNLPSENRKIIAE